MNLSLLRPHGPQRRKGMLPLLGSHHSNKDPVKRSLQSDLLQRSISHFRVEIRVTTHPLAWASQLDEHRNCFDQR